MAHPGNPDSEAVLDGRVAIVTGGGTGIGRATALAFADAGAHVLVTGRRAQPLEAVSAARTAIEAHVADVSDADTAAGTVSAAVDRWGRLDVLVNNAAVFGLAALDDADSDLVTRILETNVVGPTMLARAALPHLEQHSGSILNVSSTVGQQAAPHVAHYGASKAALDHLTRSWALELAPRGVRVNSVAPGPTESDAMRAAGLAPETIDQVKKQEAERIPLGRRGEPEDIAHWLLALADPGASWMTGQIIAVDGGLSLT